MSLYGELPGLKFVVVVLFPLNTRLRLETEASSAEISTVPQFLKVSVFSVVVSEPETDFFNVIVVPVSSVEDRIDTASLYDCTPVVIMEAQLIFVVPEIFNDVSDVVSPTVFLKVVEVAFTPNAFEPFTLFLKSTFVP